MKQLNKYAEEHPITIYADYGEELPKNIVSELLEGNIDNVYEYMSEVEVEVEFELYYGDYTQELLKEACEKFDLDIDDLTDDDIECFHDYISYDFESFWRTCMVNTRIHVVATPTKTNGEPIEFPHHSYENTTNTQLNQYLKKTHGWDGWDAETCYSYDVLKVCGTLDFHEIYEKLRKGYLIHGVQLHGSLITHNSRNGSGGMGELKDSKSKKFYKADFCNDGEDKYGVQEVFGLVEESWCKELSINYRKETKNVT